MHSRVTKKPGTLRKRKASKRITKKAPPARTPRPKPRAARTPQEIVEDYIAGVMSGRLVTGRLQKLAVKRHLADLKSAGKRGFYFSEGHALEAIDFIQTCCRHSKGQQFASKPVILTPSQKFIVWCLFGWRRNRDGLRRFKKAYLSMARKWGKSTFAAAVAMLLATFDNPLEPGAEIYSTATKEAQAAIVHGEAKRMVAQSPALREVLQVTKKSIDCPGLNAFFQVIGSDSKSTDGQNSHGCIIDELHAWRGQHRDFHEKLTTAVGARLQPLFLTITTAGDDKSEIWMEEEAYAVKTLESVITGHIVDDTQFAFICTLDEDDDPFDERCWIKANPHIGETVTIDYCREQANEAKGKPAALNKFLRYVCNRKTASRERAITPELWMRGAEPPEPIEGRVGFVAIDAGRTNDWAARAAVFPRGDGLDATLDVEIQCWAAEKSPLRLDRPPFTDFIEDGTLIVCPGDEVDFQLIEDDIAELNNLCAIQTVAADKTFVPQLLQRLELLYGMNAFAFTQSPRFYSAPIRAMQRMLSQKRLIHGNDRCLTWQAQNLTIRRNAKDEWMPEKAGGDLKVDAMVALLMAISEFLYHGSEQCNTDSAVMAL